MLVKSDGAKEKQIIENLIEEDEDLRRQHEIFEAEMLFKQELIDARINHNLEVATGKTTKRGVAVNKDTYCQIHYIKFFQ